LKIEGYCESTDEADGDVMIKELDKLQVASQGGREPASVMLPYLPITFYIFKLSIILANHSLPAATPSLSCKREDTSFRKPGIFMLFFRSFFGYGSTRYRALQ
jgi:hypothetical protein